MRANVARKVRSCKTFAARLIRIRGTQRVMTIGSDGAGADTATPRTLTGSVVQPRSAERTGLLPNRNGWGRNGTWPHDVASGASC
jgi:hypothetical protein